MKLFLTAFALLTFTLSSFAQLDKGTWLVGGTGNFSSSNKTFETTGYYQTSKSTEIKISPAVGYFFINKFAAGLKTSFSLDKEQVAGPNGGFTNIKRYEFGPYARYYFLQKDKKVNILTEASYQVGYLSFKPTKGNMNTLSLLAGPVIYFNSSVGLEFLLGYYSRTETINPSKSTKESFQVAIGFQFHLKK